MNETQKTALNFVLSFLLGVALTLAVTIPIYISSSRRADIKLGELSSRLLESNRRCTELESTIESCREPVERLKDFTTKGDGTLSGIIDSLKQIRSEVQVMEERLYMYDNSSGYNNSHNDSAVEE